MCLIARRRDGAARGRAWRGCAGAWRGAGGLAAQAGRVATAGPGGRSAMTSAPLAGRRIVVTRAERQSGGLRERLERQGAEVLLLPTIEAGFSGSHGALGEGLLAGK